MAVWTTIPNANLAAGAPIRSVDTLALRDNDIYLKQNVEIELLNTQIFTASGTWTKPTGSEYNATDTVVAMYLGAGGSGAMVRSNAAPGTGAGGSGGSIALLQFSYSSIASSLAVTIGAGGAGVTTSSFNVSTSGNTGGATIFNGYVLKGGSGGGNPVILGGGQICKSTNATNADGGNTPLITGSGRGGASNTTVNRIPNSIGGGGGGAGGINTEAVKLNKNTAGGISIFGLAGAGGSGSTSGNGGAGTAPSGGGGGVADTAQRTSGAGARGEMRIYVVRGKVPLNFFIGIL